MEVKLSKEAEKFLSSQDYKTRQRLKRGLLGLSEKPPQGDIAPMQGMDNVHRLRIGGFRVLFRQEPDFVKVIKIQSRGQVYK